MLKSIRRSLLIGGLLLFSALAANAQVHVRGYTRSNGTYVRPHERTRPNHTVTDNYSYPGNYNPNTGQITGGNPNSYSHPSSQWQTTNSDDVITGSDYVVRMPAGRSKSKDVFEGNHIIRYAFNQSTSKVLISDASVRDSYIIGDELGVLKTGTTVKIIGVDYDTYRIDYNGTVGYIPFHSVTTRQEFNSQTFIREGSPLPVDTTGKKEYRRLFDDAPLYLMAGSSTRVLCIVPRSTILQLMRTSDAFWYGQYQGYKGYISDGKISEDVVKLPK